MPLVGIRPSWVPRFYLNGGHLGFHDTNYAITLPILLTNIRHQSRDESFRSKTSFSLSPDPQELDVSFLFLYQYTLVFTKGKDGHSAAAELFKSDLIVIIQLASPCAHPLNKKLYVLSYTMYQK